MNRDQCYVILLLTIRAIVCKVRDVLIINGGVKMKLYLISQSANSGYDTFDSAVVVAPDEETARNISPDTWNGGAWCKRPDQVTVAHIGEAAEGTKQGVILASFNAG